MTRVLISDFGAIFRAGLVDLLAEAGCDVLLDPIPAGEIFEQVVLVHPGVVVLDLDRPDAEDIARSVSSRFPEVTVIACSSAETQMRVYPAFHSGESYESQLSADLLVRLSTGT